MIARRRGAHHGQERWQPRSTAVTTPKPSASATKSTPLPTRAADVEHIAQKAATDAVAELAAAAATHMTAARSTQRRRSRARTTLLMLAVAIGLFAVSTAQHVAGAGRDTTGLPATPGQWVDAYEAAAIDNPSRVCTQLLSPPARHHIRRRGTQQLHNVLRTDPKHLAQSSTRPARRDHGRS